MPFQQQDFNFVGPAYTSADPYQDRQVCVNFYCELDETKGARVPIALLGCPGLIQVAVAVPQPSGPPLYPPVPIVRFP
jgi:hypothetical protein